VNHQPDPISAKELQARLRRISAISKDLRFVGSVDYRHVYSQSGGAQYCIGPSADDDIMVLYAEAFERDANSEDFNLDALIAHECGHQRLHRDAKMKMLAAKFPGEAFEEILASLIGSLILGESESSATLVWKATMELGNLTVRPESVIPFIDRLRKLLRSFL
jgi:hypothetical protein